MGGEDCGDPGELQPGLKGAIPILQCGQRKEYWVRMWQLEKNYPHKAGLGCPPLDSHPGGASAVHSRPDEKKIHRMMAVRHQIRRLHRHNRWKTNEISLLGEKSKSGTLDSVIFRGKYSGQDWFTQAQCRIEQAPGPAGLGSRPVIEARNRIEDADAEGEECLML